MEMTSNTGSSPQGATRQAYSVTNGSDALMLLLLQCACQLMLSWAHHRITVTVHRGSAGVCTHPFERPAPPWPSAHRSSSRPCWVQDCLLAEGSSRSCASTRPMEPGSAQTQVGSCPRAAAGPRAVASWVQAHDCCCCCCCAADSAFPAALCWAVKGWCPQQARDRSEPLLLPAGAQQQGLVNFAQDTSVTHRLCCTGINLWGRPRTCVPQHCGHVQLTFRCMDWLANTLQLLCCASH